MHDARSAAGVEGGAGDDLLEQFEADAAGAGVGHHQAARGEQLEALQVDVLVGAAGGVGVARAGGEFGRVEDDDVEGFAEVLEAAQFIEDVGADPGRAGGVELRVEGEVGGGGVEGRLGAVHRDHFAGATSEGLQREASGVAEAVEHALASGELAQQGAVVALVEVEAGFVTTGDVHLHGDAVLVDDDVFFGRIAMQPAGGGLQAFELAHVGIGTLENARAAGGFDEGMDDGLAPFVAAGASELHDDGVAVLVGDEAGQTVGFGMDQAQPLLPGQHRQRLAARHGGGDAALEEGVVHRFLRVEGPHPGADLRFGAPGGLGDKAAFVVHHIHRVAGAGAALKAFDRGGENPGVLAQDGAFLAAFEYQLGH